MIAEYEDPAILLDGIAADQYLVLESNAAILPGVCPITSMMCSSELSEYALVLQHFDEIPVACCYTICYTNFISKLCGYNKKEETP